MALNTAKYEVLLNTLTAKFDNRMASSTPFYPQVCTTVQSNRLTETYGLLGGMDGMREWLGDRKFNEMRAADFSISNKHWESSALIKKTDMDDDHMGLYGPVMENLAVEAAYHPDELFFNTLLANGGSSLGFDGQYFFDTDHAWGSSGTQSNLLTPAAVAASNPTAAECKTAFNAARIKLLQYKNDKGKFLNRPLIQKMSDLIILAPPEQQQAWEDALNSVLVSNSTNIVLDRPQIKISPYLTSAAVFYVLNLGGILKPFIFQAREPLTRQMKGMDDKETKDVKFMTEARYNMGYLAWWTAIKNTFTQ